jgi:hypothetical protein
MTVVRDINENLVEALDLNPVVKNRDKRLQIDVGGIVEKQFEIVFNRVHPVCPSARR